MDELQCMTDYNLVPVDSLTCETGTNRSSIFINDIQHVWAENINITIPEEIERDYTGTEEQLEINIIGYWYDQEKMQEMINTQYYKPTAEEMSHLVETTADFMPLLAVALLVIRIRRVVKKVF